jgi:hypothetical protein
VDFFYKAFDAEALLAAGEAALTLSEKCRSWFSLFCRAARGCDEGPCRKGDSRSEFAKEEPPGQNRLCFNPIRPAGE